MKVFNIRKGFATNSSSSHSILILPKGDKKYDRIVEKESIGGFGWEFFTIKERSKKLEYIMTILDDNFKNFSSKKEFRVNNIHEILTGAEVEINKEDIDKYIIKNKKNIDHQSQVALPSNYDGSKVNKDFAIEYVKSILQKEVVILGGNDNANHDHPYKKRGELGILNNMPKEMNNKLLVAIRQNDYWVLFNRENGNKLRFSFDENAVEPTKAKVPELVDIKITDFCPYDCGFCYQDSTLSGKHGTLKNIKKIVKELSQNEVLEVALGGGETTLHPNFLEILKIFAANKVVPNFTTKNYNLLRQENAIDILKYCGAIAFSVENTKDMNKVISAQKVEEIEDKISITSTNWNRIEPPKIWSSKVVFQIVLGTQTPQELTKMLELAKETDTRITLLGYKEYGRGQDFAPYKYDNWLEIVRPFADNENISIDTALAGEFINLLEKEKIPKNTYHTTEGAFSLYIDAVKMEMAPSSYIGKEQSVSFDENWVENYKSILVDARNEKKKYIKIKNI